METAKRMTIPLTENREIVLKFTQSENNKQNNEWSLLISDECLTDIKEFFNTGYYILDSDRQITIE